MTATSVLFLTLGVLIGHMLGIPQILGNKEGFPLLAAVLGIIATGCILLLLNCPESPRFILIQMKDETKARQVLRSLRVQEDVEDEIQELCAEDLYEYTANEKEMTTWKLLRTQRFRWPVVTIIVMMAGSQLSGINGQTNKLQCGSRGLFYTGIGLFWVTHFPSLLRAADRKPKSPSFSSPQQPLGPRRPLQCNSSFSLGPQMMFYSEEVHRVMGFLEKNANILSIGINIISTLTVLTVINLIETWGRRIPLIMGFMICSMTCILLTFTLEFQVHNTLLAYLSQIFIVIFLIGHMIGPATVCVVILGELFLQSSRASAYAVGCCAMWFANCISGLILIKLESLLGPYSLLLYWPPCVATFIYLFKMIPETKGKSFLEIQKVMSERLAKPRKKKQLKMKETL
ncbi:solute carrier family 2, facilitated glucose transporter member 5-like [Candoia aspera]|uniref:solute carrier family 2, facilitated glucose transporter member 5-like n=1 Tax=Candoia aspera TaxID=51853 RepID=UPI002FD87B56